MSFGRDFDVLAYGPEKDKRINIDYRITLGEIERSTRYGGARRVRAYPILASASVITSLRAALDELADAGRDLGPFWVCDDESEYWVARFSNHPLERYQYGHRFVTLSLIEVLG